jgi:hypothetical protein
VVKKGRKAKNSDEGSSNQYDTNNSVGKSERTLDEEGMPLVSKSNQDERSERISKNQII